MKKHAKLTKANPERLRLKEMTPEFILLVHCCGIARGILPHSALAQSQIPVKFDENLFIRLAIQQKTATTALTGLKKIGLSLKLENASKLKQIALRGRMLRQLILEEAFAITQAAAKLGIPVLVLNGPASSLQLYGDALAREYTDLDILVNLRTIDTALPFMTALGWEAEDYHPIKNASLKKSKLIMQAHHVIFWKKGRPFRVELHNRTGWERELFVRDNIDGVFTRAVRLEQDGRVFFAPALPDHTVLIIAHGTTHAWALLHGLLDAVTIVSGRGLEKSRGGVPQCDTELYYGIADRIRFLDMQCQLKLVCELAKKLYSINIQPALESTIICQASLGKSIAFAFARLQTAANDIETLRNIIAYQFNYAYPFFQNPKDRFYSIFSMFQISPKDANAIPLPRPLLFIHLLLRPFFALLRVAKRNHKRKVRA